MKPRIVLSLSFLCLLSFTGRVFAAVIGPDFAPFYTVSSLGSVPGVPLVYGGLAFAPGSPNTLYIGGNANTIDGRLSSIDVVRDAGNHIIGFSGSATQLGEVGEFNDGGVVFGPGGVLFTAQWPDNNLGQTKPGSLDEDKITPLGPLGIGGESISAINFVPAGFGGAGSMKIVSWEDGNFYDVDFAPDGTGTFDLLSATLVTTLPGGPEGFVYISSLNSGFAVNSMLMSEWSAGSIAAYDLDASGDPILGTRRDFMLDIEGAEGAAIDPLTGDFLFSTFGGNNDVIVVRGFVPPSAPEPGSLALLLLGLLSAAGREARRRR
jgi:PEP-CTERM motif